MCALVTGVQTCALPILRVPHKGDVAGHVIEGAYEVLHGFDRAQESRDAMQAITLDSGESEVFARAALALTYDEATPAPITESQILMPRRHDAIGRESCRERVCQDV